MNEPGYDLVSNNCEHFAHWCKTGEKVSSQINTAVGLMVVGTLVTALVIPELIVIGIGAGAVYTGGKFISGLFKM